MTMTWKFFTFSLMLREKKNKKKWIYVITTWFYMDLVTKYSKQNDDDDDGGGGNCNNRCVKIQTDKWLKMVHALQEKYANIKYGKY